MAKASTNSAEHSVLQIGRPSDALQKATCIASSHRRFTGVVLEALSGDRLSRAKRSYATRSIDLSAATHLAVGAVRPRAGDLVLALVTHVGRPSQMVGLCRCLDLVPGDEVLLCFAESGDSENLRAFVPTRLSKCQMVSAYGFAAIDESSGAYMPPTQIEPIGLVTDSLARTLRGSRGN